MKNRIWARFVTISVPFFRSQMSRRAVGLLTLIVALLFSVSGLNVANSYVGRDFMTSISQRQMDRYPTLALMYVAVFAASTVVAVLERFTEERFGLLWRQWLTEHLIERYLDGRAYHRISASAEIDNPDQRITEDVKTFTVNTLSFAVMLLNSTITVCAFLGVLWSITPVLCLVAVLYPAFGSLMAILLGHRLVGLNNLQLKKEADLRFDLVHVREATETIALLGGEKQENDRLRRRLEKVVQNFRSIITVNRNLGFFTTGYNYLIQLIPLLIVAPLYFRRQVEFGVVTQAAMAFAHVVGAFSLIVVQFQSLSSFAAVIARLGSLWEVIEGPAVPRGPAIQVAEDDTRVAYERLTLRTPKDGRPLIKDLSVEVPRERRLLITGPNGAGKTALFRATAGIWQEGEGRIIRPHPAEIMFLPQRPPAVLGSLRDLLRYGHRDRRITDDQILAALQEVKFEAVPQRVGGLSVERDWSHLLSAGEQQILAFARLLLANPRFAFLDEATKALSADRAKSLYRLLSRTSITYLSVGDPPALQEYHDAFLEIHEDGRWRVQPTGGGAMADRPRDVS